MTGCNKIPQQCARIINYVEEFGSITQFEALRDLGIMRLASRISEMKEMGIYFDRSWETTTNRYGEKVKFMRYLKKNDNENKNTIVEACSNKIVKAYSDTIIKAYSDTIVKNY